MQLLVGLFLVLSCNAQYNKEVLIRGSKAPGGSKTQGLQGPAFLSNGQLIVASVIGNALYNIDQNTGAVSYFVSPPYGGADDIAVKPGLNGDDTVVWTNLIAGDVLKRSPDGTIGSILAGQKIPGANPIAWHPTTGELYVGALFAQDALFKVDPTGATPPSKFLDSLGGLNGFDIGTDGNLYAPLWTKEKIIKINLATKVTTVLFDAAGSVPSACNLNFQKQPTTLWCVRRIFSPYIKSELFKIDLINGNAKSTVFTYDGSIDNLAFDSSNNIALSFGENKLLLVNKDNGAIIKTIKSDLLAAVNGVSLWKPLSILPPGKTPPEYVVISDWFRFQTMNVNGPTPKQYHWTDSNNKLGPGSLPFITGGTVTGQNFVAVNPFMGELYRIDLFTSDLQNVWKGFNFPVNTVMRSDGTIFTSQFFFDPSNPQLGGNVVDQDKKVIATNLAGPTGVALSPVENDVLYVSEFLANKITKVVISTGVKTDFLVDIDQPQGIHFDPNRRSLYIVESGGNRRLLSFTLSNQRTVVIDSLLNTEPNTPVSPSGLFSAVDVSSAGTIYVTAIGDNALLKYTWTGFVINPPVVLSP